MQARNHEAQSPRKGSRAALETVVGGVIVSIQQIRDTAHVSEPTAGSIVRDFERLGILRPYIRVRAQQLWIADGVMDAVYSD